MTVKRTFPCLILLASVCALAPPALAAPPANDNRVDAKALRGLYDGDFGATNRGATKEVGEANHAGDAGGHSVWYRWPATRTMWYTVDTCDEDTTFDTLLAVYTKTGRVGSNDDATRNCGNERSRVRFKARAGVTYYIAVDGAGGATGKFELWLYPDEPFGKYVSKTSQGKRISFRMSANRKRVKEFKVGVRYRCTFNGRHRTVSDTIRQGNTVIKFRNNRFRVSVKWRQARARYSLRIYGPFIDGAFDGTLRVRVYYSGVTCDTGRVKWTA